MGHTLVQIYNNQLLRLRNYLLPSLIGFRLDDEGTHTLIISKLSVIIKIQ